MIRSLGSMPLSNYSTRINKLLVAVTLIRTFAAIIQCRVSARLCDLTRSVFALLYRGLNSTRN